MSKLNALQTNNELPSVEKVVPMSMRFMVPKTGPFGVRNEYRLPAVSSSYSTTSERIVRFYFDNTGLTDFRRGYFAFDFTVTSTANTYCRISQGIWSIINRIRLSTGVELEDMREYNLYHTIFFEMNREVDIGAVVGSSCYGYGTQYQRNLWASGIKSYAMPILCGFFLTGVVPMGRLKERLCLELYLEDPLKCVETDGTNPSFTLTNLYFIHEKLILTDKMQSEYASMADSGILFPYKRMTHYVQPVLTTTNNLVIPHSGAWVETFLSVFRPNNILSNTTISDKMITWTNPSVNQYQLRINDNYIPVEPVFFNSTDPRAYVQYLKEIGKWKLGGLLRDPPTIDYNAYTTNRFIICNNVETYPNEGLVNPISTLGAGTFCYLILNLNAVPTNVQMDTYVISYAVIDLCSGRLK